MRDHLIKVGPVGLKLAGTANISTFSFLEHDTFARFTCSPDLFFLLRVQPVDHDLALDVVGDEGKRSTNIAADVQRLSSAGTDARCHFTR